MSRHRVSSVLAAASLVVLGTPAIAQAETIAVRDRPGDAKAKHDITRVTYSNNAAAFGYRMKLRDIKRTSGVHAFPKLLVGGSWDRFFVVVSGAKRDGTRFHRLEFYGPDANGRLPCTGMTGTVNFRTDVVTARVPQSCLGDLGRRAYKTVGYVTTPGMQEAADQTRFRWVRHR